MMKKIIHGLCLLLIIILLTGCDECTHEDLTFISEVPATCTEDGVVIYECNFCWGQIEEVIPATGHSLEEWKITQEPTEDKEGSRERRCKNCNYLEEETIDKIHTHVFDVIIVEPTCITQGYTQYICHCGKETKENFVDAIGHEYGEWIIVREPTPNQTGLRERKCNRCNYVLEEEIPKSDHIHSYKTEIIEATCVDKGYIQYICECGYSYKDVFMEAYGHDEIIIKGYNASCKTPGLTDGKKCIRCLKETSPQEIIEPLGHRFGDWNVIIQPTLTTEGFRLRICDVCNEAETEEMLIDITTFIYYNIFSNLSQKYDTFIGYIDVQDQELESTYYEVYGIAYVDYSEGFIDEDGKTYFTSGFISFVDEISRDEVIYIHGHEINSIDEINNDEFSYLYGYTMEEYYGHFVLDNKYVTYEIIEDVITFQEQKFVENMNVDDRRGNIYNYDTNEYIYIVEEIDYTPISGVGLLGVLDYELIIKNANEILLTQNSNYLYENIETYVDYSMEAVNSYLLGLQEETFMGFPVNQLIEICKKLNPMEHLRISVTEQGLPSIEIINIAKISTIGEKVLVTSMCAVALVGTMVISYLNVPAGAIISGTLMGTMIEMFCQVVLNQTPMSDIEWTQVAISAAAGMIAGGVSACISKIAVQGTIQMLAREALDTIIDGVIGGGEYFVNSLIAGKSFEEACKEFGYGVVTGILFSGAIKGLLAASKAGLKYVVKKIGDKPLLVNGRKIMQKLVTSFTDVLDELREKVAKHQTIRNIRKSLNVNASQANELFEKWVKYLPGPNNKNWKIVNEFGETVSKDALIKNGGNAYIVLRNSNDFLTKSVMIDANGKPVTKIKISKASTTFEEIAQGKVVFDVEFTTNRSKNFKKFNESLVDQIKNNYENQGIRVKNWIADQIRKGEIVDIDFIDATDIDRMMNDLRLTWHESPDMKSAYLVPREVHNASLGGISHCGGISELKYKMAKEMNESFKKGAVPNV